MIAAPAVETEPACSLVRWIDYTEATARAEIRELAAYDAELEARARWRGGQPAALRASSRERLLRSVPSDLAPDIIKEFAQAERYATLASTARPISRGRRTARAERSASASDRETARDEDGEPPPRYLPVVPSRYS